MPRGNAPAAHPSTPARGRPREGARGRRRGLQRRAAVHRARRRAGGGPSSGGCGRASRLIDEADRGLGAPPVPLGIGESVSGAPCGPAVDCTRGPNGREMEWAFLKWSQRLNDAKPELEREQEEKFKELERHLDQEPGSLETKYHNAI